jgi:small subunit ribosomal protein S11
MAKEPTKKPEITEAEAPVTEAIAEAPETEATTPAPDTEAADAPTADTEAETTEATPKPRKKKNRRSVPSGQIHVLATFNNTIITVTDDKGNALASASAGGSGFRGSKKGTAYAAQIAAEKAISTARSNFGLTRADVFVKGVGMGRDAAIRTLVSQKVQLENIKDVTGIPHGGVRPRKPKRN